MITLRENFNLAEITTFSIGALCRGLVEYDSSVDIPDVLSLGSPGTPVKHIGEGSNMLFTDDYPGYVARSRIRDVEVINTSDGTDCGDDVIVRVGAGKKMDDFISEACRQGLWGLENLSGIPGEAGASAVQNVGAYGTEAADAIVAVHAYDSASRQFVTIPAADCRFAYRDSLFKHSPGRFVIHHVDYRLTRKHSPRLTYPALRQRFEATAPVSPEQVREAVTAIRDSKLPDPAIVPSAGSFFKNPVVTQADLDYIIKVEGNDRFPHYPSGDAMWKLSAAWLIDHAGCKGLSVGGASVWPLQPLVLVNAGRTATAADVVALERLIIDRVRSAYRVSLTPEVEHIPANNPKTPDNI